MLTSARQRKWNRLLLPVISLQITLLSSICRWWCPNWRVCSITPIWMGDTSSNAIPPSKLVLAHLFPLIIDPHTWPLLWGNGVVVIDGLESMVCTVHLLTQPPHHHSTWDHRNCGFMATAATAHLLKLLQIAYPVNCSGPTAVLTGGFLRLPASV